MSIPKEVGIGVGPNSTMPLTAMLKRLKLKMASLQSARTQCCCCAVGVFAAMFGIFMLSAGICIVLNVTFMEVDTSGLPPNLHNESGKKVVGIILICVAIACLGLSATVSILYFTLCTRKSRKFTQSSVNGPQQQQKHSTTGTASGQDRLKTGEPGAKRKAQTDVQLPRSGIYSRSEIKPKPHRRGNKEWHRSNRLPPHIEEDLEATKSTMELHTANETHPRRSSQGRIHTQKRVEEETASSVEVMPPKLKPPTIIVDDMKAGRSVLAETQLNDANSVFEEDSVSNIYSDLLEDSASAGWISPYDTFRSDFTNRSYLQSSSTFTQRSFDDLDLQPPPELPHNIEVRTDISLSDLPHISMLRQSYLNSPHISTLRQSFLNSQHDLLMVKPAKGADLVVTSSSSDTLDTITGEDHDNLCDLPIGQHDNQTVYKNRLEQEIRSESRSSFNSAFSLDGGDPDQSEVERLRIKIDNLLDSDGCDGDK